ncbi:hypothetical protein [Wolbachia endosymbiont (group B) of Melanostoma mellinum]|uniref:hypothetical protein n=1 Tax=Wolbachia endosymbiont (group B) of Melanostoma mellinum TaxID=2954030 RepID=UPI0022324814|nr:hypothetical protein [Wolbachia endosymbiont (group B) of Melanostoma mellinum]
MQKTLKSKDSQEELKGKILKNFEDYEKCYEKSHEEYHKNATEDIKKGLDEAIKKESDID